MKGIPTWPEEAEAVEALARILDMEPTSATKLVRSAIKTREHQRVKAEVAKTGFYHGFYARPEDANVIIEHEACTPYERLDIQAGDVVLDIGANIGTTVRYALIQGASHVIAVEPVPATAALLRRNCLGSPVTVIEAAVGASDIWVGKVPSCATSFPAHPDRIEGEHFDVAEVSFAELLDEFEPHVVKLDCEGAEWPILKAVRCELGPRARSLGFEGHVYSPQAKDDAAEVWAQLAGAGWRGRSAYARPPVGNRRMFFFERTPLTIADIADLF